MFDIDIMYDIFNTFNLIGKILTGRNWSSYSKSLSQAEVTSDSFRMREKMCEIIESIVKLGRKYNNSLLAFLLEYTNLVHTQFQIVSGSSYQLYVPLDDYVSSFWTHGFVHCYTFFFIYKLQFLNPARNCLIFLAIFKAQSCLVSCLSYRLT